MANERDEACSQVGSGQQEPPTSEDILACELEKTRQRQEALKREPPPTSEDILARELEKFQASEGGEKAA